MNNTLLDGSCLFWMDYAFSFQRCLPAVIDPVDFLTTPISSLRQSQPSHLRQSHLPIGSTFSPYFKKLHSLASRSYTLLPATSCGYLAQRVTRSPTSALKSPQVILSQVLPTLCHTSTMCAALDTTGDAVPSTAVILLDLILNILWACLSDTPTKKKNPYYAQLFDTLLSIESAASESAIAFCPGLLGILQADAPPSIGLLKTLPREKIPYWGVYLLVLEKPGAQPRVYIGSGTNSIGGITYRLKHYDDGYHLPSLMVPSLEDGYTITHKAVLCWAPIPDAETAPICRLLLFAMEATFAYVFWAMNPKAEAVSMSHICPWQLDTFEYLGLCSHCCLTETPRGSFDLTPEQLKAVAGDKEKKFRQLKAQNAQNYHYKQMATNYDKYIGDSSARVAKSRANNPGRDAAHQARRAADALATQRYHCDRCNLSFSSSQSLQDHLKSAKHKRKSNEARNPFKCKPCNLGFHNQSNLTRHNLTERHKKAVALHGQTIAHLTPWNITSQSSDLIAVAHEEATSSNDRATRSTLGALLSPSSNAFDSASVATPFTRGTTQLTLSFLASQSSDSFTHPSPEVPSSNEGAAQSSFQLD